jgi:NADPH:quinone reductase-like Zn-dependent oxidoreductase
MKAIVYRGAAGGGFVVDQVEEPAANDDQVLVAVQAAAVNILDWYLAAGFVSKLLSRGKAVRVGRDFAGVVEAVGRNVTRVKPGDEVFGVARGAFAEYVTTTAELVALKPANVSFKQAAGAGVAGLTALQALRDAGKLERGQKVLINGASGGIGTFMVQIAKALGAQVTGVCSGPNLEMIRSIGADHGIDYQREDFATGSARYDLIVDVVAARAWLRRARMLAPGGRYVFVGGPPLRAIGLFFISFMAGRRLITFVTKPRARDLDTLREMMSTGQVRPVVGRVYDLASAGEAVRYVTAGHTRGKAVILIR